MDARAVAAGRGWQWIVNGFSLFRKVPLMWIALTIVLVLLWMVSFLVPVIGPLLFNLFSPVLFAGLMLGCKAVEAGEDLEISHLFAGFQKHAAPLVTVGGVYLVGTIIIVGIIFATAGGAMLPTVLSKSPTDLQTLSAALRSMALALSVGFAFYIPLIMLIWFAPVLVVLHDMAPVAAMKLSFRASWINMMPFLVYGLAIMVLWFIASIPLLLGLVVLVPVLICSVYASYRDIFLQMSPPDPAS
ncbi:MAG: BPSS1780 family membrane protein [Pseudomonadota bacterium]